MVAPVAVIDDVDGHVVDDLGVRAADDAGIELVKRIHQPECERVLAVFADVGDHVAHAHDASFEGGGAQMLDLLFVGRAGFHGSIERREVRHAAKAQRLLGELAVMAQHAVERLQADVAAVKLVEHAYGMDVMVEKTAGMIVEAFGEKVLSRMAERRVAHIVAKRDGFDEVEVQTQERANTTRYARDELYVQAATAQVVVLHEGEDLRLVRVAVVRGHVQDLLDIARERWPREGRGVVGVVLAAHDAFVGKAPRARDMVLAVRADARFDVGVERKIGYIPVGTGVLRHRSSWAPQPSPRCEVSRVSSAIVPLAGRAGRRQVQGLRIREGIATKCACETPSLFLSCRQAVRPSAVRGRCAKVGGIQSAVARWQALAERGRHGGHQRRGRTPRA